MEGFSKTDSFLSPLRLPCKVFKDERQRLVLDADTGRLLKRFGHLICAAQKTNCVNSPLNGVLLFKGRPGRGKSMTARATAQTLAEQYYNVFKHETILFEFSASTFFSDLLGKTVKEIANVFEMIRFSVERRQTIVIMDDLESVAFARTKVSAGDPSDVTRAVNELLRQLDSMRGSPKFLLIGTTNLPSLLDRAFIDRADYVITFKDPDIRAAAAILRHAAEQARCVGIRVSTEELRKTAEVLCGNHTPRPSGRLLSKLPLAGYVEGGTTQPSASLLIEIAQRKMSDGEDVS